MVAACLALSCVMILSVFLIAKRMSDTKNTGYVEDGMGLLSTTVTNAQNLDETLLKCRNEDTGAVYTVLKDAASLDFFTGKAQVAWQYENESTVYLSRALQTEELKVLQSAIENGTSIGESSITPKCKIWILYGDGNVITPYLHPSNGNVGAGELFDYAVEVVPNADFASCLSDILY